MMEKTAEQIRYDKLGETVAKALRKRFFDAWYFDNKEAAVAQALSLIPEGTSVSWGGSMSIVEVGLKDKIQNGKYKLIDRDTAKTPEERIEIMRQALLADTFLMSANAISEDGQLFNVDGNGNRLAALLYGPKQVIVIAGVNKIAHTAADALERARTIAAPTNISRFDVATPCKITGTCSDCTTAESQCAQIVQTRICRPAGRIKVILVGTKLGY
ncbi:MAG TPA: lactate utilization protein [Flexilinea sp.]|jgi:hypothetical protein|nr:MAG: hypothetical protein BWY58_00386 [Chloroflexi bacterium ADurb.Bin344]HOG21420.1 lactate utilization protein [Flexilinea sp.]HOP02575.1 lactate utilization protein [Flexilinea sp.]HOU18927.1 lactate utilization protein [Flexilinea sp.]HPJ65227.1 lactate utilization protein [Flexilinea sp.]